MNVDDLRHGLLLTTGVSAQPYERDVLGRVRDIDIELQLLEDGTTTPRDAQVLPMQLDFHDVATIRIDLTLKTRQQGHYYHDILS